MELVPQLTDSAHAIHLAVTPIFLLAGVGITVNILTARLGRIVDRARGLTEPRQAAEAPASAPLTAELAVLARRARLVYLAMALRIPCALCLCLPVTALFVGSWLALNLATLLTRLSVTAMLALIGALLTFFREILLATRHLRIGPKAS